MCKRASFCLPIVVGATEIAIVEGVAPSDVFCCCRLWWATVCRLLLEFASLHRQAGGGGGDGDDGGGSTHGLIGWLGSVCRDAVDGKLLVVFFFHFFFGKAVSRTLGCTSYVGRLVGRTLLHRRRPLLCEPVCVCVYVSDAVCLCQLYLHALSRSNSCSLLPFTLVQRLRCDTVLCAGLYVCVCACSSKTLLCAFLCQMSVAACSYTYDCVCFYLCVCVRLCLKLWRVFGISDSHVSKSLRHIQTFQVYVVVVAVVVVVFGRGAVGVGRHALRSTSSSCLSPSHSFALFLYHTSSLIFIHIKATLKAPKFHKFKCII